MRKSNNHNPFFSERPWRCDAALGTFPTDEREDHTHTQHIAYIPYRVAYTTFALNDDDGSAAASLISLR